MYRAAARYAACAWFRRCRARPNVETLQSFKRTASPGSGKRDRSQESRLCCRCTRPPVPRRRPPSCQTQTFFRHVGSMTVLHRSIAITRPSSGTFLPRTPPSSYPIPTPYYSPVRPREDIPDARFLLRPTWVAPAREMPASCSPTRSFFRPPVAALGPHLAPLLAPSPPARHSGLATLPGQGAALLGPTSARRCPCEEVPSRCRCPSLFYPYLEGRTSRLLGILEKRE